MCRGPFLYVVVTHTKTHNVCVFSYMHIRANQLSQVSAASWRVLRVLLGGGNRERETGPSRYGQCTTNHARRVSVT